jgi:hypothetical protein
LRLLACAGAVGSPGALFPTSKLPSFCQVASKDPQQRFIMLADGQNERVRVIVRDTLREITSFGDGGRQPGEFYGVHSIASDSKGNLYTTETYEGKRVQKFIYKGIGSVPLGYQGVLWPKKSWRR